MCSGFVSRIEFARRAGLPLLLLLAACGAAPPAPVAAPGPAQGPAAVEPAEAAEAAETGDPPEPASPARPAPPPAATAPAAQKPDIRRLRVAMVGDMMLGTDYPENHLPDDDGESFLAAVAPVIAAADLAIGNLEGTLVEGGEPAKQCRNPRACFLFRSPPRYAAHYARAGFDVLSLANNHARDFGEDGRTATMQALAAHGIRHTGREGDFATLKVRGLDVAVLGFAVTRESNLLHDYALAEQTVRAFAARHDIVIVTFHGGAEGGDVSRLPFAEEEYYGEPRGDVVRFARLAVDAGADLVFGHGPHVVRAVELYRDRLIAYSLGNFATYYGISVEGLKGVAPILEAELDYQGRFLEGRVHSTVQVRPGGPRPDPQARALKELAALTARDFGGRAGVEFLPDGRLLRRSPPPPP